MRRVVVFGGAGFIGRSLVNRINDQGLGLAIAADNLGVRPEDDIEDSLVRCDVKSPKEIKRVLGQTLPQTIVWLPARQGYRGDLVNFAKVQVDGTYALFQAMKSLKYLPEMVLLASSQAVYEPGTDLVEESPKRPASVYGLSKWQQEEAFTWFCRFHDVRLVSMRYSIVLGAGQAMQAHETGLLRNWVRKLRCERRPQIFGDGRQVRDFVHIDDVTDANIGALDSADDVSGPFNISGPRHSINHVAKVFHEASGCLEPCTTNEDMRPGGEYSMTSDSGRATDVLGWKPSRKLENMIRDFLDSTGAR